MPCQSLLSPRCTCENFRTEKGVETIPYNPDPLWNSSTKNSEPRSPPAPRLAGGPIPGPGRLSFYVEALRPGDVDGAADLGEGAVGIGAKGGDRRDADHDDQGQHDRVLDSRRAVFTLQEFNRELSELTHEPHPFERTRNWKQSRPVTW